MPLHLLNNLTTLGTCKWILSLRPQASGLLAECVGRRGSKLGAAAVSLTALVPAPPPQQSAQELNKYSWADDAALLAGPGGHTGPSFWTDPQRRKLGSHSLVPPDQDRARGNLLPKAQGRHHNSELSRKEMPGLAETIQLSAKPRLLDGGF